MINIKVKDINGSVIFNRGYTNHVKAQSVFFAKTGGKHCPEIDDVVNSKSYSFDNVTAEFVR